MNLSFRTPPNEARLNRNWMILLDFQIRFDALITAWLEVRTTSNSLYEYNIIELAKIVPHSRRLRPSFSLLPVSLFRGCLAFLPLWPSVSGLANYFPDCKRTALQRPVRIERRPGSQ